MFRFTALNKKGCLKEIQIFFWIFHFSNLLRKTHFMSISVLFFEIVTFLTKKRSFKWISPKMLQNNRKAWFSSMWLIWGEKKFLLIIVPFYWFVQKQLFKQIQIFLLVCPFSNLLRKTNILSISVLLSEIVTFLNKKRSLQWISPKMLQNNRKA